MYVPILKWRRGEHRAIINLEDAIKDYIIPLLEVVPFKESKPKEPNTEGKKRKQKEPKKFEDYIKFGKGIFDSFGSKELFIDLKYLDEAHQYSAGVWQEIFDDLSGYKISCIPVISINRSIQHNDDLATLFNTNNHKACLRIYHDQLDSVGKILDSVTDRFPLERKNIYVLIDFGDINDQSCLTKIKSTINGMPFVNDWNKIIFSATSAPKDTSSINKNSIKELQRFEWKVWNELRKDKSIKRIPYYSDYGIACTSLPPNTIPGLSGNASVRYTYKDVRVIFKADSLKEYTHEQYYELADDIRNSKYYSGIDYSWGDFMINEIANRSCSHGSRETWVSIAVNHHITCVVNQVSSLTSV